MGLEIECCIEYASPLIKKQTCIFDTTKHLFKTDIAKARTFGFLHEVEMLRQNGFARGGSLENSIVISNDTVLNDEGLRYTDEFVRHKVLDAMGDLYTAGYPIIGKYTGIKSGHAYTNQLLRKLMADQSAWEFVDYDQHLKNPSSVPSSQKAVA